MYSSPHDEISRCAAHREHHPLLVLLTDAQRLLRTGSTAVSSTAAYRGGSYTPFGTTSHVDTVVAETITQCNDVLRPAAAPARYAAPSSTGRSSAPVRSGTQALPPLEDMLCVCTQLARLAVLILQHGVVGPLAWSDDVAGDATPALLHHRTPQECASLAMRCYEEIQRLISPYRTGKLLNKSVAAATSAALAVATREMQLLRVALTVEANAQMWFRWCLAASRRRVRGSVDHHAYDEEENNSVADSTAITPAPHPSSNIFLSLPTDLVCEELVLCELAHVEPVSLRSTVVTEFVCGMLDIDGDGHITIADMILLAPSRSLVQLVEEEISAAARSHHHAAHQSQQPSEDDDGVAHHSGEGDTVLCENCERLEAELVLARHEIDRLKAELRQQQNKENKHLPRISIAPRYAGPIGQARGAAKKTIEVASPRTVPAVHEISRGAGTAHEAVNRRVSGDVVADTTQRNAAFPAAAVAPSVSEFFSNRTREALTAVDHREASRFERAAHDHAVFHQRQHAHGVSPYPNTPIMHTTPLPPPDDAAVEALFGELDSVVYGPTLLEHSRMVDRHANAQQSSPTHVKQGPAQSVTAPPSNATPPHAVPQMSARQQMIHRSLYEDDEEDF